MISRCPVCGGEPVRKYKAVAHDEPNAMVSIVECGRCQMAWQYPLRRTKEESANYFTQKYIRQENGTYFDPEMRRQIALMQADYVCSLKPNRGRILDVGAGDGVFLDVASDLGWKGIGIEPAGIREQRQKELICKGITLVQGTFDELPPDVRFDVITLWDVIEHVDEPIGLLKAVYGRLKPDGIVLLETGNYHCAAIIE